MIVQAGPIAFPPEVHVWIANVNFLWIANVNFVLKVNGQQPLALHLPVNAMDFVHKVNGQQPLAFHLTVNVMEYVHKVVTPHKQDQLLMQYVFHAKKDQAI